MSYQQSAEALFATIGSRMRAVRMAKGINADELARKLAIARPTLVNWEADRTVNIRPDQLEKFAKVTGVPTAWLVERKGTPPKLDFSKVPKRRGGGTASDASPALQSAELPPSNLTALEPAAQAAVIAEIKPRLSAHAKELDTTPQASWTIPREVMTLGFNCDPVQGFIHRSAMDEPAMPDGTPVNRGDYILIDPTRTLIDEPGVYYVADPDGVEARRVVATAVDGKLMIKAHRSGETVELTPGLNVLGRVMAVFHAL